MLTNDQMVDKIRQELTADYSEDAIGEIVINLIKRLENEYPGFADELVEPICDFVNEQ